MRLTTAAVVVLFLVSLYLASLCLAWQAGHERARRECHEQALAGTNAAVDALHTELAGINTTLAQVRAAEQQRNHEGEQRREEIRTTLRGHSCADVAVPDAVVKRLSRHTLPRSDNAHTVRTSAGKSDAGNAGAVPATPGDVGRTGAVE